MKKTNFLFKVAAILVIAFGSFGWAFAQTEISDRAGLEAINGNLSGSYVLTADIDLAGTDWTPLGNFTGTLDGAGHVIRNMTITPQDAMGFFGTISGNAWVKNLGFENAYAVISTGQSRTAVLAAFLEGNAVIENCYIANSTVGGRWCVGSFVGRARNLTDGGNAAIRNCYSSAYLYTLARTDNNNSGHIGGIIGNIYDANKIVVENCYFSGIIQKEPCTDRAAEGQVAGIVGWIGNDESQTLSGHAIQNNVNLAPYLLSNDGKHRISSVKNDDSNGSDPTPGPNYSLASTVVAAYGAWGNASAVVTTGTTTNKDGANIPDGDANAKSQSFYETTLGWDFSGEKAWAINNSYPYFKWADATRPHWVVTPAAANLSLTVDAPIDLSRYIFSGRGLPLTFSTESDKISISGSTVSIASPISAVEKVTVSVQEGSLTPFYSLEINLVPEYVAIATPDDLDKIRELPAAKYVLTADLDLSSVENFVPIPNFTGTLDGAGHVIKNMTINPQDAMGFFAIISGNALVKNLGFENAYAVITEGQARTAVLAAFLEGNAVIENCYIANSTVGGRWCVGSFVGRARNLTDEGNAAIRNCYSSAYLYTLARTDNNNSGHIGGIIGNIYDANKIVVENCYFSGIIQKEPCTDRAAEGQVAGIVGWIGSDESQTLSGHAIQNNVNLAPYLLSNDGKHRISSVKNDDSDGSDPTPGPNYSLASTIVSNYNDWGNAAAVVTTGTTTNKDGANIPDGDANAKVQSFYETTLGWDFSGEKAWAINNSYPYFKWADQTRPHFVVAPNAVIAPTSDTPVDLSKYIFSGRGLNLTFSTTSDKIAVNNGVVSIAQAVAAEEKVVVSVQEGSLTPSYSLEINLTPSYNVAVGTFAGGAITTDKGFYEAGKTVTLTIAPATGYELESISAYKTGEQETVVALTGEGNERTFEMPAYGVTVTASFQNLTAIQTATVSPVSIIAGKGEIKASFEGTAAIKLYSVTGLLLDETTAGGVYSAHVKSGVYILSVAGKATKVVVNE